MTVRLEAQTDCDFRAWMARQSERIERSLDRVLPPIDGKSPGVRLQSLHEAMRYAVLGGGKRVRPLLVYAAGDVSGAAPGPLDGSACAVELMHAYSLVHDDMPCMDNDELRRGKPTVHRKYGEAQAMLVGDALQALAFEVLVAPLHSGGGPGSASKSAEAPIAAMVLTLATAAGAAGMAGGQALDLDAVGAMLDIAQLQTMHAMKTGAMLAASARLGMLCGGEASAESIAAIAAYGESVGLAFQIVDDILDVTADSKTLGKTPGKDEAQDKPTYVSILGLDRSRVLARQLGERARASVSLFGARGDRLAKLADFIVDRVN